MNIVIFLLVCMRPTAASGAHLRFGCRWVTVSHCRMGQSSAATELRQVALTRSMQDSCRDHNALKPMLIALLMSCSSCHTDHHTRFMTAIVGQLSFALGPCCSACNQKAVMTRHDTTMI